MLTNLFLLLVFGSLPLFMLAGGGVFLFRNRSAERDFLLRVFFPILLFLPLIGLTVPRTATTQPEQPAPPQLVFTEPEPPIPIIETEFYVETPLPPPLPIPSEKPHVAESPPVVTPVAAVAVKPKPPVIAREPLSLQFVLFVGTVLWLVGTIPCLVLILRSRLIYCEIIRKAEALNDPAWTVLCDELERTLGIVRSVRYCVTESVAVPQVVGLRRPTVLLPRHFLDGPPNRAILIHELEHVRRNDIAWQLLVGAACSLYWFQPLVWFFAARQRAAREEACDDQVLRLGEKASDYARILLDLSSLVQRGYHLPPGIGCAVTMPRKRRQVERRIVSLLDPQRKREPISRTVRGGILCGIIVATLASVAVCPALESPKNETKKQVEPQGPETARSTAPASALSLPLPTELPGADGDYVTDPKAIGVQYVAPMNIARANRPLRFAVVYEDGNPAVGARVAAIAGYDNVDALDLTTDAGGRFLLWQCPGVRGNFDVFVQEKSDASGGRVGFVKTDRKENSYKIILKPSRTLRGTVVDKDTKPLPRFFARTKEFGTVSGNDGKFEIPIPADAEPTQIVAWNNGDGLAYKFFRNEKNRKETENDSLYVDVDQPVELQLDGTAPLTLRAVDTEGNALAGVDFLFGFAYPPRMVGSDLKTSPWIGLPVPIRTSDDGSVTVDFFPNWMQGRVSMSFSATNDDIPKRYLATETRGHTVDGKPTIYVAEFLKTVPVSGTVRYPDGKPVAGLKIKTMGIGVALNDHWNSATTDAEGRYRLMLPPYQWYVMAAPVQNDWAFPTQDGFAVMPGDPIENFDVVMEPATQLTLKVLGDPDRKPFVDRKLFLAYTGRSDHDIERIGTQPIPSGFRIPIYRGMQANRFPETTVGTYTTDADGCITLPVGSGRYAYRLQEAEKHDFFGTGGVFEIKHDPQRREVVREILVQTEEESTLRGTVLTQDASGQWIPAADVPVSASGPPTWYPGKSSKQQYGPPTKTDAAGKFSYTRANHTLQVFVYDAKAKRAAYAALAATEREVTLKLQPLASVTGLIVNLETGEPIKRAKVEYRSRYEFEGSISCGRNSIGFRPQDEGVFYKSVTTDATGRFTIRDILADTKYDLHLDRSGQTGRQFNTWQIGGFRTPSESTLVDVGEFRVAAIPPVGTQVVAGTEQSQRFDLGGIADNLYQARYKTSPETSWARVEYYQTAILKLIELNQLDGAKAAAKEMIELVTETKKALKEKNVRFDEQRFDENVLAVANAFETKGETAFAAEMKGPLGSIDELALFRQRMHTHTPEALDGLLATIEKIAPEKEKDDLIWNLFVNGMRGKLSLADAVERTRKLARPVARVKLLFNYAGDFAREGDDARKEELFNEALAQLKALPTADERAPLWIHVIGRRLRQSDRNIDDDLLRQAAGEMYDKLQKEKKTFAEPFPNVDFEKAKEVGSEEFTRIREVTWPFMQYVTERTYPVQALLEIGEKEKALSLAEEIASYKDYLSNEQLLACRYTGGIEGALACAAGVFAECGKIDEAKVVWKRVLEMCEVGDAQRQSSAIWSVVLYVQSDLFKEDVRHLCLQSIERLKTWEDEDRPETTMFRRVNNAATKAGVLARNGFSEDARRVLDELAASIRNNVSPEYSDGCRAQLAEGYANANFPDKAKEVAQTIENAELKAKTLKVIERPKNDTKKEQKKILSLTVLDPAGKPLPNIEVEVRMRPQPTEWTTKPELFVRDTRYGKFLKTDEKGNVPIRLANETVTGLECFVQTDGYTPFYAGWGRGGTEPIPSEYAIKLDKAATVGIRFVNEKDEPVEDVTIHPSVEYKKRDDDLSQLGMGRTSKSDKNGVWTFASAPIRPEGLRVQIAHQDFMPLLMTLPLDEYVVDAQGVPKKKIVLDSGYVISGALTDDAGKPIADGRIRTRLFNTKRETKTDEHGEYRFPAFPEGKHRIFATAKDRAPEQRTVELPKDGPKELAAVNFQLKPGGTVRVVVTEKDGRPIPKTRIFFQRWRDRNSSLEENYGLDMIHNYTDENGVWTWNESPPDGIYVDICAPGKMQLGQQHLVPRAGEYRFTPPSELVVTGKVVDADSGEPINKTSVIPGWYSGGPYDDKAHWTISNRFEAVAGTYRFATNSSRAGHGFRIEAEGYMPFESQRFNGDEGSVTLDVALKKGNDIMPTVLGADGIPVAGADVLLGINGAQISIRNGEVFETSTFCNRVKTDKDGKFRLTPQKTLYELVIVHPDGVAWVFGEPDKPPQTITLERWARLDGVMKLGDPKTQLETVTLSETLRSRPEKQRHDDREFLANASFNNSMQTDADGKFSFLKVLPGAISVGRSITFAKGRQFSGTTTSHSKWLILGPGEAATVEIGGSGGAVVGKLAMPEDFDGKPDWNFCLVRLNKNRREKFPSIPDEIIAMIPENIRSETNADKRRQIQEAWNQTEEGKKYFEERQKFLIKAEIAMNEVAKTRLSDIVNLACPVSADGSFRLEAVPPGEWSLSVRLTEEDMGMNVVGTVQKDIIVPEMAGAPLDLGTLTLTVSKPH